MKEAKKSAVTGTEYSKAMTEISSACGKYFAMVCSSCSSVFSNFGVESINESAVGLKYVLFSLAIRLFVISKLCSSFLLMGSMYSEKFYKLSSS